MDLRGRTIGSENPNEVGNPAVLLKGLDDVPKRSVKPKGSQEPLLTGTANVNPPLGTQFLRRRKLKEAVVKLRKRWRSPKTMMLVRPN